MKTTNNFKPGDKVYVLPSEPPDEDECYIRATITSIHPELGYMLRAFRKDLPGLYMGRIWDDRLILRKNKIKHKAIKHKI